MAQYLHYRDQGPYQIVHHQNTFMKARKIFLTLAAFVISASAFSQTDSTKKITNTVKESLDKMDTASAAVKHITQDATNSQTTTATGSSSNIVVPKPNHGRYYIAVLGTYRADQTATEAKSVSVTPDEENPGKIWVEGLTDTRFYALLKSAPGTYKIPAQLQNDKQVAEGEIKYDEENKSITICVGCGFAQKNLNETPAPVVTSTAKNAKTDKSVKKAKSTIINFTGTKTDTGLSLR